jgi:hypothetical protein
VGAAAADPACVRFMRSFERRHVPATARRVPCTLSTVISPASAALASFRGVLQVFLGSKLDPDGAGGGASKKRPAAAAPAVSDADVVQHTPWKDLVAKGTLRSKTMDTLKAYCRHHKLPLASKKAELLDRVTAHVQKS